MAQTHLYLLHAQSPLHCGTGQAVSGIDLPIAREKPTGIPLVPGSSLKGVLRASSSDEDLQHAVFGPDTQHAADHAGAVQFSDANLLLLPLRSVRGTFAWVTSPYMLRRLARDAKECGHDWDVPWRPEPARNACLVTGDRLVVASGKDRRVVLEDFDFSCEKSEPLAKLGKTLGASLFGEDAKDDIDFLVEHLCVVSDDVMRTLCRVGMEVTTRNRIENETKTVARGALWTEEALPAETILCGVLVTTRVSRGKDKTMHDDAALIEHVRTLCKSAIQVGGKATIGRGLCRMGIV